MVTQICPLHRVKKTSFISFTAAQGFTFSPAQDEAPVALVAWQVPAFGVTARQQRLQVVEHQQAALGLQACQQLGDALLQRCGECGGRRLGEESDAVGDQLLARRCVTYRAPKYGLKPVSQTLTQEGDQHTLADAAHPQQRHTPARSIG